MLIIFVSFMILTAVISSMTIQSATEQRRTVARNTSKYIEDYLKSEVSYPTLNSMLKNLSSMIDILSKNAEKMTIIITDINRNVIASTDGTYNGIRVEHPETTTALGGETSVQLENTDLGGILDTSRDAYVTPVAFANGNRLGLIVCYSADEMDNLTLNSVRTIVLASLWVMIASFIAIYFITEKIVSPLKQMSRATKRFASGQFDQKIPVVGDDEIAELSTAFNSMADSLAKLEYMRSSFLANVSHDLRTPMTTISGYIDGILAGAIPPEKESYYLGIIAQEIRRLSRLVSSLLDISRMEAGNRKFEKTPFDICEMARLILISFEAKIDDKKLEVEFDAPEKLFVYSDKDAIYQVVYNICDNAVKFSKDGGKYIIKIEECAQNRAAISVYNEGIGILPEDLPHVFDRFYKSDKSRGIDKSGVGLGLYIVKTVIDNLGESISAESVYGEYCKFTVKIVKYKGKLPATHETPTTETK